MVEPRPIAIACGPVIGCGQIWEPEDYGSIMAGVAKNHPDQVPVDELHPDLFAIIADYLILEISGKYDAMGDGCLWTADPLPVNSVLAHVAEKNPAKARRYFEKYLDWVAHEEPWSRSHHEALIKVKVEMLKWGKVPRVITDFHSACTVIAHQFSIPLEKFLKTRVSWKGLKLRDKWKPVAALAARFNYDVYMLFLDDVARDGNTMAHDLVVFVCLLVMAGTMTGGDDVDTVSIIILAGIWARTSVGQLWSCLIRLFSGASYTSCMNFVTSRALWHFIRFLLGLTPMEFAVACEGDDNAGAICGEAFRSKGLALDESVVAGLGRQYGKILKIEAHGWLLPRTAWPCVGGHAVYLGEYVWRFIPSVSRAVIKAGWSVCYDFGHKSCVGRVTARAWALNDRFCHIPIFWVYSHVVAGYAAALGGSPVFDREEQFLMEEEGWDGTLALPPDDHYRDAFHVVTGVCPAQQAVVERRLKEVLLAGDWLADLTPLFEDLFHV